MENLDLDLPYQDIFKNKNMKKQILLIVSALLISTSIFCQSLKINSEKAVVNFNFISEKTVGTVTGINATINFDASNLSISSIEGTADVKTLSTKNKMRDNHLQQEDMFNVEEYPTMDFKSSLISKTEKGFAMKGLLKIKGTEKEVVINFTYSEKTFIGKTIIYSKFQNHPGKSNQRKSDTFLTKFCFLVFFLFDFKLRKFYFLNFVVSKGTYRSR